MSHCVPRNSRRSIVVGTLAMLVFSAFASAVMSAQPARPNIIIVLVDDMGYSDLGCYGSEIETPNIDSLAAGGIRFTQFYNYGRCCPTRASLMTGLHPHDVGIGHMTETPEGPLGFEGPYQGFLNDRCATLAEVLKGAGYRTLMTGKWHLGYHRQDCWPLQRGFDRYFGCISGACNYFKPDADRGLTLGNEPFQVGDDFYTTDAFTDKACEFISEAKQTSDDPFFLYLAYNAPHWPLNAKWEDYLKYKGKYTGGWEQLMARRLEKQKAMGLMPADTQPAPHPGPTWDSLTAKQRQNQDAIMSAYAACVDSIDQNIGKLLRHLESEGVRDNTVVFFLSDNGACQEGGRLGNGNEEMVRNPPPGTAGVHQGLAWAVASNTPLRLYKHFVHEGGAATPLIVHWPDGIPSRQHGKFVRQYAYLPDFMPTCIELAGAKYPAELPSLQGASMMPLLQGDEQPIHTQPIFWEHEGNAAVRWGRWKLVREYEKPWELYDIEQDRAELHDLSDSQTAVRSDLIAQWESWATDHQVAFPKRFNMYEFLQQKKQSAKP